MQILCNVNQGSQVHFFSLFLCGDSRIYIFDLAIASNCLQLRFIWFRVDECTTTAIARSNDGGVVKIERK